MSSNTVPIESITDAIVAEYTAPMAMAKSAPVQFTPAVGKQPQKPKRKKR